jgi:hypothetical protein
MFAGTIDPSVTVAIAVLLAVFRTMAVAPIGRNVAGTCIASAFLIHVSFLLRESPATISKVRAERHDGRRCLRIDSRSPWASAPKAGTQDDDPELAHDGLRFANAARAKRQFAMRVLAGISERLAMARRLGVLHSCG